MISSKIQIPDVTLIAMGSTNVDGMVDALEKSSEYIEFGAIKLVSDYCPRINRNFMGRVEHYFTPKMRSIDSWNYAIIYELHKYIKTSHALLVHPDGYIINPELWNDNWLKYDWASSPWPLPQDYFSYRDEQGNIVRVGNSVGLRSKRLMELVATIPWRTYYGNTNEDGFICCHNRKWLESQGCTFMPFEEAIHFGKEHELPENIGLKTFLFHSV